MKTAVVLAFLVVPLVAHGDPKQEAKQHVAKATQLHEAGQFKPALDEMMVAYALDPEPDLLFAIAQLHVKLGDCPQAILFYERFLSTRPVTIAADAAHEAIETCKRGAAPPAPAPAPEAKPTTEPVSPVTSPPPVETHRWYKDRIGGALVGAGVVAGIVALVEYRSAVGTLDDADAAPTYPEHHALVEDAHGKRTIATVFAVASVGLIAGGSVRYFMVKRRESQTLAITPTSHGAAVTWTVPW